MVLQCSACKLQIVRHTAPTQADMSCCGQSLWIEIPEEEQSDLAKSWNRLLGKSDEELLEFCQNLAKEA